MEWRRQRDDSAAAASDRRTERADGPVSDISPFLPLLAPVWTSLSSYANVMSVSPLFFGLFRE